MTNKTLNEQLPNTSDTIFGWYKKYKEVPTKPEQDQKTKKQPENQQQPQNQQEPEKEQPIQVPVDWKPQSGTKITHKKDNSSMPVEYRFGNKGFWLINNTRLNDSKLIAALNLAAYKQELQKKPQQPTATPPIAEAVINRWKLLANIK